MHNWGLTFCVVRETGNWKFLLLQQLRSYQDKRLSTMYKHLRLSNKAEGEPA